MKTVLNKFRYEYDSMPHLACESRNYQVGNGSLTGYYDGRIIDENHYLSEGSWDLTLPTIFHENRREE